VQIRLPSPGLLHVEKIQEWTKRNNFQQENHPEVKYFLDNIKILYEGLKKGKMAYQAVGPPTEVAEYPAQAT
jgi:hypothetical protein